MREGSDLGGRGRTGERGRAVDRGGLGDLEGVVVLGGEEGGELGEEGLEAGG